MKRRVLRVLERAGLLGPAYRDYEHALALRGRHDRAAVDGLPVPPSELIVRVAGTADVDWFLEGGRRGYETVRAQVPGEPARLVLRLAGPGFGVARQPARLGLQRARAAATLLLLRHRSVSSRATLSPAIGVIAVTQSNASPFTGFLGNCARTRTCPLATLRGARYTSPPS